MIKPHPAGKNRAIRIISRATSVFGSKTSALKWLKTPNHELGGQLCPWDLVKTDSGAARVESMLSRLDAGYT